MNISGMRVLVLGLGAVGGYFGGRLALSGVPVTAVARGANLAALRDGPLRITSFQGDFDVRLPVVAEPVASDLVLFCVKSYDTEAAAASLLPVLGAETTILCLQNGVDNEARIAAICGAERVAPGVAYIAAERVGPGHIEHTASGSLDIGGPQAEAIVALFISAGVRARAVADAPAAKWRKLVLNCASNAMTAVAGVRTGPILADPEASMVLRAVMAEGLRVARAEGIDLADGEVDRLLRGLAGLDMGSSTLQDRLRGAPLEAEALNGTIVRLGRRHGIPVPCNETLYALLRLISPPSG